MNLSLDTFTGTGADAASASVGVRSSAGWVTLFGSGAALMLAGLYHLDPNADNPLLCPYRAWTGLACPGCGLTRAAHYVLRGDVAAAWTFNPLLFIAAPLVLAFAVLPRLTHDAAATRWRTRLGWAVLVIVLGFWVWRNTAAYPFLRL